MKKSLIKIYLNKQPVIKNVNSHFLDSGAFTHWKKAKDYFTKNGGNKWDYYNTKEFLNYLDSYILFIKKYKKIINLYANLDVIENPSLSWKHQKYMEKHELQPVPVIHCGSNIKWLEMYLDKEYPIIGIGGLAGKMSSKRRIEWLNKYFNVICDTPDKTPKTKIHGFGITSHKLLFKYPWWSVDSTSWTKIGMYGSIIIPYKIKGSFVFNKSPYVISISLESPDIKKRGLHYQTLPQKGKNIIKEWLERIKIPLGNIDKKGNIIELGVQTFHCFRIQACLLYFEELQKIFPKYPQPFKGRKGLF